MDRRGKGKKKFRKTRCQRCQRCRCIVTPYQTGLHERCLPRCPRSFPWCHKEPPAHLGDMSIRFVGGETARSPVSRASSCRGNCRMFSGGGNEYKNPIKKKKWCWIILDVIKRSQFAHFHPTQPFAFEKKTNKNTKKIHRKKTKKAKDQKAVGRVQKIFFSLKREDTQL